MCMISDLYNGSLAEFDIIQIRVYNVNNGIFITEFIGDDGYERT